MKTFLFLTNAKVQEQVTLSPNTQVSLQGVITHWCQLTSISGSLKPLPFRWASLTITS